MRSTLEYFIQTYDDLTHSRIFPDVYRKDLRERLRILCWKRQAPQKVRTSRSEHDRNHRRLHARDAYMRVLEKHPAMFLPFFLAVSTRACEGIKLEKYIEIHATRPRIELNKAMQSIIEEEIKNARVWNDMNTQKLRKVLFTQDNPHIWEPTTTSNPWTLPTSNLDAVKNFFGEWVCSAIENSTTRVIERAQLESSGFSKPITKAVRSEFPEANAEDAAVYLDIGFDSKLILSLFPRAQEEVFGLWYAPQGTDILDNDCLTLRGACVSAVCSIFGSQTCEAIQGSQLRQWEQLHDPMNEMTDCATVYISRSPPHNSIVRLRVGYVDGFDIARLLHA